MLELLGMLQLYNIFSLIIKPILGDKIKHSHSHLHQIQLLNEGPNIYNIKLFITFSTKISPLHNFHFQILGNLATFFQAHTDGSYGALYSYILLVTLCLLTIEFSELKIIVLVTSHKIKDKKSAKTDNLKIMNKLI